MLFLLIFFNLYGISLLHASSDTLYPEVGKPCPQFLLKNVAYYKKKEVKLADFKGKWLVLDFWNKYCSACIESFPKVNAMQKKFASNVQFMLVGIQDAEGQIKTMYERFQNRFNLALPCAFDSTLSNYWGIYNTPHIIILDDKGIVQAVTYAVDSSQIQAFLKGEHPILSVVPFAAQRKGAASNIGEQRIPFNDHKPYMIAGNGANSDTGFLFRSMLSKWNQANQDGYAPLIINHHSLDPKIPKGTFQALGVNLRQLFLYAYFGRWLWYPNDTMFYGKYSKNVVLEVKDSSIFQFSANGENIFCYSLILPPEKGTSENLQKAMQRDLESYFGFKASIQIRKVRCWRLVASDSAAKKLSTKGGKLRREEIIPHVSYKYINIPMKDFVQYLLQFTKNEIIIDETGISNNIDITTDCMDFDSMKAFLPKYGLRLILGDKEMNVLVVRDASREDNNVTSN